MVRTQISLSDDQKRILDAESSRSGCSLAELIRRAVDRVYGSGVGTEEAIATIAAAAGSWPDRKEDGATYVDRLRSDRLISR